MSVSVVRSIASVQKHDFWTGSNHLGWLWRLTTRPRPHRVRAAICCRFSSGTWPDGASVAEALTQLHTAVQCAIDDDSLLNCQLKTQS